MAEKWDKQFMDFIKRTGEEIKRTGEDIRVEAQRLLDEVRDPERQAKLKVTLSEFRDKAAAVTKDAAEKLENAARQVEDFVSRGIDRTDKPAEAPPAQPKEASAEPAAPARPPARKTGKTIGKKAAAKKAPAAKTPAAKAPAAKKAASKTGKTIGRKKS